jgi:hypothetical protein
MDEVGSCWAAVADLLCGGEPDTDKLAVLLGYLGRQYAAAREGFSDCVRAGHAPGIRRS